jgi:hypothetical protein
MNLLARLRAIFYQAEPTLIAAIRPGWLVRGGQAADIVISQLVRESAIEGVCEQLAALQATFKATPETRIDFQLRHEVPLFVNRIIFNKLVGQANKVYTRRHLETFAKDGLLEASTRVVVRLNTASRRVVLTYQPSILHAVQLCLSPGAARRLQVARLPGGFVYTRTDGPTGRAYYTVEPHAGRETAAVVAVDPGVRVFATMLLVNSGQVLASNDAYTYMRMQAANQLSEKLMATSALVAPGALRNELRRQAQDVRTQVRNRVSDMHCRLMQFFVDNANIVLMPRLPVSAMMKRYNEEDDKHRLINSTTARNMATLRFGHFHANGMPSKLRFHPSVQVFDVSEDYSTRGECAAFYLFGC